MLSDLCKAIYKGPRLASSCLLACALLLVIDKMDLVMIGAETQMREVAETEQKRKIAEG